MHVCTVIAKNYLASARALSHSLRVTNPAATFHVLVIDNEAGSLRHEGESFELLRLQDIGFDTAEIHRLAAIYDIREFASAVKPWLISYLMDYWHETVIFLDPDIAVYESLNDIVEFATTCDIVLTPHVTHPVPRDGRTVSESDILSTGIYNLGFIAISPTANDFLNYWKERLRRDCIIDVQGMRFVDQKWIDFAPGMFNVKILRDPTYNVAYWNLSQRALRWEDNGYLVDDQPLHFFHFSGYDPEVPELLSKHQTGKARVLLSEQLAVAKISNEYRKLLIANGYEESSLLTYSFSNFSSDVELDLYMRRIYREALIEAENNLLPEPPNPFDHPEQFLEMLNTQVPGRGLSRYLATIYDAEFGAKGDSVDIRWVASTGSTERPRGKEITRQIHHRLVPQNSVSDPNDIGDALPSADVVVPGFLIVGSFRAENGVGELGRLAIRAIKASGITYSTFNEEMPNARQNHIFNDRNRGDLNINLICLNADSLPQFADRVGYQFFDGRFNIGLWAWELEEFPEYFSSAFDYVDEIWALSEFARKAITTRTDKPVYTFPVPLLPPEIPAEIGNISGIDGEHYMFLFCFDMESIFERKNPLGLVEAFTRAFTAGEGPILLIKALNGDRHLAEIERLKLFAAYRSDIVILDHYLDESENVTLMASCDCYVSLHRSEGLGLTIAEAMSLGKPVVATGYSGNLDFMVEDTAYFVPFARGRVPEGCDPYPVGAHWAEPDIDVASALMRHVFLNPKDAIETGKRARKHIIKNHSLAASTPFVRDRYEAAQRALEERFTQHIVEPAADNKGKQEDRGVTNLLRQLDEARSLQLLPIQGYLEQIGTAEGFYPGGWTDTTMTVELCPNRPLHSLVVNAYSPQGSSRELMAFVNNELVIGVEISANATTTIEIPVLKEIGDKFSLRLEVSKPHFAQGDTRELGILLTSLIANHQDSATSPRP